MPARTRFSVLEGELHFPFVAHVGVCVCACTFDYMYVTSEGTSRVSDLSTARPPHCLCSLLHNETLRSLLERWKSLEKAGEVGF